MAGKRTASSELNHTNWDREEDAEDAGTFKKASQDVLEKRVIKTARRRAVGSFGAQQEGGEDGAKKSIFGGFTAFAKTSADPGSAFSFLKSSVPNTNGMDKNELLKHNNNNKSDEYYAKMKGLNESVSSWIKKHVDENPFINLKPIFTDYEKYFDEIEADSSKTAQTGGAGDKKDESIAKFTFGTSEKTAQFTYGAKETSEPKTTGFNFGGPTTARGAFAPAAQMFAFNAAPTTQQQSETSESKDDEDEPPKAEFTRVVEDDHIYTTECKVFVKKDGNFGDRGVGTLYLKPVPGKEKVQLIVRANTNLGNLLCNFILSASVPTQRIGKKDVMLVCVPNADSQPPPVPVLIRVKSPEKADELLQTLEKHKK